MKYKAFKFRIKPNQTQKVLINKTFGCTRFLYNQMLNERQSKYKLQDKSKLKTEKDYKIDFEWLKEVDSTALQQARIDLETAYKNFFRKLKAGQPTNLKFKSKHNTKNSYRTFNGNNNTSIRIEDNKIRLPKLGFVKFKKSREVSGVIKSATISKNILGRYYISIICKVDIEHLPKLDTQIGIDLGLKEFCVTSDGEFVSNYRHLRKCEDKLKKTQKILSRRTKGSKNRFKQQKKLFKIHEKIRNQRLDFLHKLSTKIINENQVICLEDLQVKNMVKNHRLAKSISDVSWSKFVELLKYKSEWYGRTLVQVGKFYPSSKTCSVCGNIKKDLTIKDRKYNCSSCGTIIDRDYNASLNILTEGLRILNKNRRDGGVSLLNIQANICSS